MLADKMRSDLEEYAKIQSGDPVTEPLFDAAVQLAESATGKRFEVENGEPKSQLYWLAIKQIVIHWYDNRGAVSEKSLENIPLSANELLNHIALSSDFLGVSG